MAIGSSQVAPIMKEKLVSHTQDVFAGYESQYLPHIVLNFNVFKFKSV